jgi:hypothetical protein
MKSIRKSKRPPSAEALARMAEKGVDVSKHFNNNGKMMPPIQRVNVAKRAQRAA